MPFTFNVSFNVSLKRMTQRQKKEMDILELTRMVNGLHESHLLTVMVNAKI